MLSKMIPRVMTRLTSKLTQIRNMSTTNSNKSFEIYQRQKKLGDKIDALFKTTKYQEIIDTIDNATEFNSHPSLIALRKSADDRKKLEYEILKKSGWFTTSENIETKKLPRQQNNVIRGITPLKPENDAFKNTI